MLIFCSVIDFALPWRQYLPVNVCLFSSPSLHPPSDTLSLSLQDLYPSIARTIRESWQTRWDNKLALIKPAVERWSSSTQRVRHQEVVLPVLHMDVSWHAPTLPNVPLSVVHFLDNYRRYTSLRRSSLPSLRHVPSMMWSKSILGLYGGKPTNDK